MASRIDVYIHFEAELKKLYSEYTYHSKQIKQGDYFYADTMEDYIERYNNFLAKYKEASGIPLEKFELKPFEYSGSGKTIRESGVERFGINITSTIDIIGQRLYEEKNKEKTSEVPLHQMRKCLKIGVKGCPKNPGLTSNKVFIGMPFDDSYKDSYEYGIKLALESMGFIPYKANDEISNQDIMCKVCHEMQMSKYLIFNISGLNPNVMMELGFSYGLGKETIVVKDKSTKSISDIAGIEYIEYAHAGDLQGKIKNYFEKK